jgi:hypothetical protein
MGQGAVDEGRPQKDEGDEGENPASLTRTPDGDGTHCRLKDELELGEQNLGDATDGIGQHAPVEGLLEIADDAAALAVGQRIADQPPLDGADSDGQDGGHEGGEGVAAGGIARVAHADGGDDGPAEDAAYENEDGVDAVTGLPGLEDGGRHGAWLWPWRWVPAGVRGRVPGYLRRGPRGGSWTIYAGVSTNAMSTSNWGCFPPGSVDGLWCSWKRIESYIWPACLISLALERWMEDGPRYSVPQ